MTHSDGPGRPTSEVRVLDVATGKVIEADHRQALRDRHTAVGQEPPSLEQIYLTLVGEEWKQCTIL